MQAWGHEFNVYTEQGELLDRAEATMISSAFWGVIDDAFEHSREHTETISPDESLLDFFKSRLGEQVVPLPDGKGRLSAEQKHQVLQLAEMWGGFIGDPISRQSLKYFWLEETIEGGEPRSEHEVFLLTRSRKSLRCQHVQGDSRPCSQASPGRSSGTALDQGHVRRNSARGRLPEQ